MKMLRFSLGVTRVNKIRDDYIRGTAHDGKFGNKAREVRLCWFGRVWRGGRHGTHQVKGVKDGAARQEEKGKAKEEVYGCSEGGHAGARWGEQGKTETDDPLWQPLKGAAERGRIFMLQQVDSKS